MLPKVATHILHASSRAAAAAGHNQTHTIRNVIHGQLQASPAGPSSSSSGSGGPGSRGNAGPGTGGSSSKGSRFYSGYNGAGRAVTQANTLTAQSDGSFSQSDDTTAPNGDRHGRGVLRSSSSTTHQKRHRIRSSSLSISVQGRKERGETMGVLKTVLIHTRSKHVFAPAVEGDVEPHGEKAVRKVLVRRNSTSSSDGLSSPVLRASTPQQTRRNSTVSHLDLAQSATDLSIPPLPKSSPQSQPLPTDPSTPQSTLYPGTTTAPTPETGYKNLPHTPPYTPTPEKSTASQFAPSSYAAKLRAASDTRDASVVAQAVREFRMRPSPASATPSPSSSAADSAYQEEVAAYNWAFTALLQTRSPGEPLTMLLETYNDMLQRSVMPNVGTYIILIRALTERDLEVTQVKNLLKGRVKRRELTGRLELATEEMDEKRLAKLEQDGEENNFISAMALFESVLALGYNRHLPLQSYLTLLRSCSFRGNVEGAIHVFAQLERRHELKRTPGCYRYLLMTYVNADDVAGAERVWEEYGRAAGAGELVWPENAEDATTEGAEIATTDMPYTYAPTTTKRLTPVEQVKQQLMRDHVRIYNSMIETYFRFGMPEKAVELVDRMLNSKALLPTTTTKSATPPSTPTLKEPPPIAPSTFTTVLSGFISSGDVPTALKWFERLLAQGARATSDPYAGVSGGGPMKPDAIAWGLMLDALASARMIDELNRVWNLMIKEFALSTTKDLSKVKPVWRQVAFCANMEHLSGEHGLAMAKEKVQEVIKFLMGSVIRGREVDVVGGGGSGGEEWGVVGWKHRAVMMIIEEQLRRGWVNEAVGMMNEYYSTAWVRHESAASGSDAMVNLQQSLVKHINTVYDNMLESPELLKDFKTPLVLMRLEHTLHVAPASRNIVMLLHSYGEALKAGTLPYAQIDTVDWESLLESAVYVEDLASKGTTIAVPENFAYPGIVALLKDMVNAGGVKLEALREDLVRAAFAVVAKQHGVEELKSLAESLGPAFKHVLDEAVGVQYEALEEALNATPPPTPPPVSPLVPQSHSQLRIDPTQTRHLELFLNIRGDLQRSAFKAYDNFAQGLRRGKVASPIALGRLIQAMGRYKEMDKVMEIYTVCQIILKGLEDKKALQAQFWFTVEDQMIVALAHGGDVDAAHVHRQRILENGGAPSADAYAALILHVKDTTDDTSNAMALFQESQMHGVQPNQYLFNNVISKLAKARKTDYALELFQQMKACGINPSSITYGAVIGACARVGDVESAEALFDEMVKSKSFKPRVPPYNTMMQLYTTTRPNRERAIYYYNQMLHHAVVPSMHTYKLLLDAYGAIEPVDIESMEQVFAELEKRPEIPITGVHFGALINAYGCVKKDLDKAIEVFDSISTKHNQSPDAMIFEAMFNAFVANKRSDLIPEYVNKMNAAGVHMTAYIANLLIKGYASAGDLEQARGIFESLVDPPIGMAAPNNHAPHDLSSAGHVDPMAPVYREPSTWEAMIRAELGTGERQRAHDLLERLRARQYPEAVFNRISGILVDHSAVLA